MMPRPASPRRKLSMLLASTALFAGYSGMDIQTASAAEPSAAPAATAPAGDNPLLAKWTGPFEGVPPWDKMDPELFPDAFTKAMAEVKAEVQAVIDNPEAATFDNRFVPMMPAGDTMDRRSEEHTSELQSLMRISY